MNNKKALSVFDMHASQEIQFIHRHGKHHPCPKKKKNHIFTLNLQELSSPVFSFITMLVSKHPIINVHG